MSRAARNIPTLAEVATLLEGGAPQRAERACRALLKREPRNAEAWHLHGIAALQKNDLKEARERIERAIALNADDALYHSNLGVALERLGDLKASHRAHERALALDPAPADNWFNHGLIALRLGRASEAEASLRTACERAPDDPEFALNLGHARWRMSDLEGALNAYRSAFNLVERLARGRSSPPAAGSLESRIRHALLKALETVFPTETAPELRRLLVAELSPELAGAAAAQLRAGLPPIASLDDVDKVTEFMREAGADPLWLHYLESCINRDPVLERWLVRARAHCLKDDVSLDERFVAALAVQCFHNEFVWYVGIAEEELLAAPMERLSQALANPGDALQVASLVPDLLRVSLYRPLPDLEPAEKLLDIESGAWPAPVANLLERAVHQPLDERRRADELPSLAPVRDATSHLVRGQYEENPYPRWLALPARADIVPESAGSEVGLGAALDRRFSDRAACGCAPRSILAAGAGTGYEALLAARQNPRAVVTLLDLSRTSLAYAARMAACLGLDNVRFVHGDLLDAEKLDERFDLILASGVLHHMAEPGAGLRALAGALAPDGSLKLGLYSGAARKFVDEARAWAERAGHEGSPSGIRAFRRDLIERARPEFARLLTSADVHTMSGCRDLVFHVHEHVFDLGEVEALLADAGLRLLGFDPDAGARAAYRQRFPDDPALRSFAHLTEFEREHPEVFAGMYLLWAEPANAARARASGSPLSSTESHTQSTATV